MLGLKTVALDAVANEALNQKMASLIIDPLKVKNGEQPMLIQVCKPSKRNILILRSIAKCQAATWTAGQVGQEFPHGGLELCARRRIGHLPVERPPVIASVLGTRCRSGQPHSHEGSWRQRDHCLFERRCGTRDALPQVFGHQGVLRTGCRQSPARFHRAV